MFIPRHFLLPMAELCYGNAYGLLSQTRSAHTVCFRSANSEPMALSFAGFALSKRRNPNLTASSQFGFRLFWHCSLPSRTLYHLLPSHATCLNPSFHGTHCPKEQIVQAVGYGQMLHPAVQIPDTSDGLHLVRG